VLTTYADGKISPKKVDFENNALFEHDGHDEFNSWEKGFLAVGTLGIGPLDDGIQPQCYDEIIKEISDDHDHDHKESCLALGDHLRDDKHDEHDNVKNHEILMLRHELKKSGSGCDEIEEITEDIANVELKEDNQSQKTECKGRKRRVTLADLFLEDSDHHAHHIVKEVEDECHVQDNSVDIRKPNKTKKKRSNRARNGFIKAKKLLKDDFRPLEMFNQVNMLD